MWYGGMEGRRLQSRGQPWQGVLTVSAILSCQPGVSLEPSVSRCGEVTPPPAGCSSAVMTGPSQYKQCCFLATSEDSIKHRILQPPSTRFPLLSSAPGWELGAWWEMSSRQPWPGSGGQSSLMQMIIPQSGIQTWWIDLIETKCICIQIYLCTMYIHFCRYLCCRLKISCVICVKKLRICDKLNTNIWTSQIQYWFQLSSEYLDINGLTDYFLDIHT